MKKVLITTTVALILASGMFAQARNERSPHPDSHPISIEFYKLTKGCKNVAPREPRFLFAGQLS